MHGTLSLEPTRLRFTCAAAGGGPNIDISCERLADLLEPRPGEVPDSILKAADRMKTAASAGRFVANLTGGMIGGVGGRMVSAVGGSAANEAQRRTAAGPPPKNRLTVLLIDGSTRHRVIFDVQGNTREEAEVQANTFWMRAASVRRHFGHQVSSQPANTTKATILASGDVGPTDSAPATRVIGCPKCQSKLRVKSPGAVQCPSCATKIRVPDSLF
jgi:hypothetical protein